MLGVTAANTPTPTPESAPKNVNELTCKNDGKGGLNNVIAYVCIQKYLSFLTVFRYIFSLKISLLIMQDEKNICT